MLIIFDKTKEQNMHHLVLLAVGGLIWGWIVWIIIGGLAGWLAGLVVRELASASWVILL